MDRRKQLEVIADARRRRQVLHGSGLARTALRGNIVFPHSLSRGDHVLEGAATFANNNGDYSITYHLHVHPR